MFSIYYITFTYFIIFPAASCATATVHVPFTLFPLPFGFMFIIIIHTSYISQRYSNCVVIYLIVSYLSSLQADLSSSAGKDQEKYTYTVTVAYYY